MILDSECLTTTFHTERKRRNKSGRGEIRERKEVNSGAGSANRSLSFSRDCLIVLIKPMGVLKSMWDETTYAPSPFYKLRTAALTCTEESGGSIANINTDGTFTHVEEDEVEEF